MSSICRFISYLYCWIYSSYKLHKNWIKVFKNQTGLLFNLKLKVTLFYVLSFFSFVLSLTVILCHSLSFFVTRCHSFSLAVIRCHLLYHSLSLFVPLVVICCHLLYHSLSFVATHHQSLSLVVTRCTTRLSFCKRW